MIQVKFTQFTTNSQNQKKYIWLKIKRDLIPTQEDIYLGAVSPLTSLMTCFPALSHKYVITRGREI